MSTALPSTGLRVPRGPILTLAIGPWGPIAHGKVQQAGQREKSGSRRACARQTHDLSNLILHCRRPHSAGRKAMLTIRCWTGAESIAISLLQHALAIAGDDAFPPALDGRRGPGGPLWGQEAEKTKRPAILAGIVKIYYVGPDRAIRRGPTGQMPSRTFGVLRPAATPATRFGAPPTAWPNSALVILRMPRTERAGAAMLLDACGSVVAFCRPAGKKRPATVMVPPQSGHFSRSKII
jgi:hypothetical protein